MLRKRRMLRMLRIARMLCIPRMFPSRSALCQFFMSRPDYERERDLQVRLSAAELLPGGSTSLR